jgi:hypothetical protein
MSDQMTRGEREDLQRLVRQREKAMKSAAKQRSLELLADFENQISAEYAFDDDAVWAEATRIADAEVKRLQETVARRCAELGIMPELSYQAIAGESAPPIIEQILTPNAIRQRRYRDKQKALRDGDVTSEKEAYERANVNGTPMDEPEPNA